MFRVQVVCEGPTDTVVIEAALAHHLEDFVLTQIQPEQSLYGGDQGPLGGGWKGVRSWCRQVGDLGGLEASGRLRNTGLLVVHVDADVADDEEVACARVCPPPSDTTDALREVLLSWMGEPRTPPSLLFCIPSKAMEAWVLAGLHPTDRHVVPCDPPPADGRCLECRENPASLLVDKPTKLVRRKQGQLRKDTAGYLKQRNRLTEEWPRIVRLCQEAGRFDREVGTALGD